MGAVRRKWDAVQFLDMYRNNPYIFSMEDIMTQNVLQPSRMDLRIPQEVRDIIDRAASMEGRTRTDFVIAAALERAEQVIERRKVIRLTMQDQDLLVRSLLENRVEDTPQYVKDIAREYADRVVSE